VWPQLPLEACLPGLRHMEAQVSPGLSGFSFPYHSFCSVSFDFGDPQALFFPPLFHLITECLRYVTRKVCRCVELLTRQPAGGPGGARLSEPMGPGTRPASFLFTMLHQFHRRAEGFSPLGRPRQCSAFLLTPAFVIMD
jgi:hypothetical protein